VLGKRSRDRWTIEEINRQTNSPELRPHDEEDIDKLDYATIVRMVHPKKGRWLRFSEEQIERMVEHEKQRCTGVKTETEGQSAAAASSSSIPQ
jgi:hypothetical protein